MKILEDGTLSITVTGLMDFCKTPKHFKWFQIDKKRKESASMTSGTLLHLSVFEPQRFEDEYYSDVTIPEEFTMLKTVKDLQRFLDSRNVVYKKSASKPELIQIADPLVQSEEFTYIWDKYIETYADKQHVPTGVYDQVMAMTESVHQHPFFNRYVGSGDVETKMTTMINGVEIRGRLDWHFFNERMNYYIVADLKQAVSAQINAFERKCYHEKYFIQAYLYKKMVEELFSKEALYTYIAVEPSAPYICEVYAADDGHLSAAEELVNAKIEQLKYCVKNNFWPGYSDQVLSNIGLPSYAYDAVEKELECLKLKKM